MEVEEVSFRGRQVKHEDTMVRSAHLSGLLFVGGLFFLMVAVSQLG